MLMIELMSAHELATRLGFANSSGPFRNFCARVGIQPIRRKPHYFDPVHVRFQLDKAQHIPPHPAEGERKETGLVAQRRLRRAQQ
ncbi:hypothetical protein Q4511_10565 [Paracoccus sp. 1_MG-2023]|uniref:hypothetical protein n=1 Tax=unclassified Paracoccus (in: a-proteobacteria) TaxID=2688777 RepID=UPI001C0A518D|nr:MULTISPECIES: hypothetical protein [unclassified Paracoccus (in: a-proteobacteria)]MBU2958048.1 hypothetical protein [Paracoccus sp. C2R09]MDO6669366.1 hypothetical protein [Paracoccus sp. 1_MG-2023]